MARHPNGARAGQNARNQTYTILLIILAIGVVIAFFYGPFGKNKPEPVGADPAAQDSMAPDTNSVEAVVPEVNETVALAPPVELAAEPNVPELNAAEPNGVLPGFAGPTPAAATQPVTQLGAEAAVLIAEADKLIMMGSSGIIAARDKLNEALRMPMSPQQRAGVKEQLSKLSDQWLFGRTVLPNDGLSESYLVRSGDRLAVIADKYKIPYELLMQINNISNPRALRAGATIKVVKGPFHAKVYRSTFAMDVYLQNTYVRTYSVGLGKAGRETPTGLWRVRPGGKAYATSWRDPDTGIVYQPEDPDYPLGSRWIALEGLSGEAKGRQGFGIHGTKEPDQIGGPGSRGCIRMHNGEAIQVYNMLVPALSTVEVID
jgi:lipoprotein-anchoring transpeptidase ErfK/SrfK